jgi:hypothetical protein
MNQVDNGKVTLNHEVTPRARQGKGITTSKNCCNKSRAALLAFYGFYGLGLAKSIQDSSAFFHVVAIHSNIDAASRRPIVLVVGLYNTMNHNATPSFVALIERFHFSQRFGRTSSKVDVATTTKENRTLKPKVLSKAVERHQRRATSRDAWVDVHQIAPALRVKQNVNAAETPEAKRVAVSHEPSSTKGSCIFFKFS